MVPVVVVVLPEILMIAGIAVVSLTKVRSVKAEGRVQGRERCSGDGEAGCSFLLSRFS